MYNAHADNLLSKAARNRATADDLNRTNSWPQMARAKAALANRLDGKAADWLWETQQVTLDEYRAEQRAAFRRTFG